MKREADKIAEKLAASEAKLESVEQQVPMDPIQRAPLKLHRQMYRGQDSQIKQEN